MRRLFSILAILAGLVLVAGFVSAIVAPCARRVPLAKAAVVATLAIHATAGVFVVILGRNVSATATRLGLPDWVAAQAEKNQRKTFVYFRFGLPMVCLAVFADVILTNEPVGLGIQAANLAFQLGAFFAMTLVIVAQERLWRDVRGWANSLGPVF